MAVIYDYQAYFALKHLNHFSRSSDDVVCQVGRLKKDYVKLQKGLKIMEGHHRQFMEDLGDYLTRLDQALAFGQDCRDACELDTVEDMIQMRDRLKVQRF